jgi:hypothetical protein
MRGRGGGGCLLCAGKGSPVPRTALIARAYALSSQGCLPLWNNLLTNYPRLLTYVLISEITRNGHTAQRAERILGKF